MDLTSCFNFLHSFKLFFFVFWKELFSSLIIPVDLQRSVFQTPAHTSHFDQSVAMNTQAIQFYILFHLYEQLLNFCDGCISGVSSKSICAIPRFAPWPVSDVSLLPGKRFVCDSYFHKPLACFMISKQATNFSVPPPSHMREEFCQPPPALPHASHSQSSRDDPLPANPYHQNPTTGGWPVDHGNYF